jgi:UDP-N-acetylmuramoyl-tripeptide--D-alanyl-D-alanine ligase
LKDEAFFLTKMKELYAAYLKSEGITTDTRSISQNQIYFALKGPTFNGNRFAKKALDKGASLVVLDENDLTISTNKKYLCNNVLATLQGLANYHRKQLKNTQFIGITGTNGKTTTKELLVSILKTTFNTTATEGNLNNHIGVPLTILKIKPDTQVAIIEMGANKVGDIEELASITEPEFGLITNIGKAHLEGFKTENNILLTKTELYRNIEKRKGTIFVHGKYESLKNKVPKVCKTIFYQDCENEVKSCCVKVNTQFPYLNIELKTKNEVVQIQTQLYGEYNIPNVSAAAAIALHFNVSLNNIKQALESFVSNNQRSEIKKTSKNTLIIDAYNANVTSMNAALESFSKLQNTKTFVILGEMLELGVSSEKEHLLLIETCKKLNLTGIAIGSEYANANFNSDFIYFPNKEALLHSQELQRIKNYTILLKGSRGSKIEELIPEL